MRFFVFLSLISTLCISACVSLPAAQLDHKLDSTLYPAELTGIRWGVLVSDLDGEVLVAHRADDRFSPASNTKLFTTAVGFHFKDQLDARAPSLATRVEYEAGAGTQLPNLVLRGFGDPALSDSSDCDTQCMTHLARNIVESGVTEVGDIIGDARWFPEQAWPPGWSWEDLQWGYGASVAALGVNNNLFELYIAPGPRVGATPDIRLLTGQDTYRLASTVTTVDTVSNRLAITRLPGEETVRLAGEITQDTPPQTLRLGVDRPAHFAAERLKAALRDAGTQVHGQLRSRTLPPTYPVAGENAETIALCIPEPVVHKPLDSTIIAQLAPPNWQAMLRDINKLSQNLYAEMMLRQIGRLCGAGTTEDGLEQIDALMNETNAPADSYSLFDGSGMSIYNRVSPRALNALLVYAARQEWGTDWRQTFPIAGVDGGLERRFLGTALEGRLFAKTGTLKGVNALSGYMIARSGRTLAFSIIANDRPLSVRSGRPYMDAALVAIAERY